MEAIVLKNAPELKEIIQIAFPSYKKHKAYLREFHSGMNINSYWSGGSKDEYAFVNLETKQRIPIPSHTHPYFDIAGRGLANQETEAIAIDHVGNVSLKYIPDNVVVVSAGTFCGKPATAFVYANTSNLTKLLKA